MITGQLQTTTVEMLRRKTGECSTPAAHHYQQESSQINFRSPPSPISQLTRTSPLCPPNLAIVLPKPDKGAAQHANLKGTPLKPNDMPLSQHGMLGGTPGNRSPNACHHSGHTFVVHRRNEGRRPNIRRRIRNRRRYFLTKMSENVK